jgi:hypothetical protein
MRTSHRLSLRAVQLVVLHVPGIGHRRRARWRQNVSGSSGWFRRAWRCRGCAGRMVRAGLPGRRSGPFARSGTRPGGWPHRWRDHAGAGDRSPTWLYGRYECRHHSRPTVVAGVSIRQGALCPSVTSLRGHLPWRQPTRRGVTAAVLTQVDAHDLVAGGRDSTAVAVLTMVAVDAHGERVTRGPPRFPPVARSFGLRRPLAWRARRTGPALRGSLPEGAYQACFQPPAAGCKGCANRSSPASSSGCGGGQVTAGFAGGFMTK